MRLRRHRTKDYQPHAVVCAQFAVLQLAKALLEFCVDIFVCW